MNARIGHGYDLHRLEALAPEGGGRPFVLGGVAIGSDRGPVAHSDGDALLHAVTDALLGAIGAEDIGQLFPEWDPAHEGADSAAFAIKAMEAVRERGLELVNLDATVVCERPKLREHKGAIVGRLSEILGVERERVNVKGKTHEGVDAIGEGRAIEVHCVVLLGARER